MCQHVRSIPGTYGWHQTMRTEYSSTGRRTWPVCPSDAFWGGTLCCHIRHKALLGDGNVRTGLLTTLLITVRDCRAKQQPRGKCLLTVEWQVLPLSRWEVLWPINEPPVEQGVHFKTLEKQFPLPHSAPSADQWKGCPMCSKYSHHLLQSAHEDSVYWGPRCCWASAIFRGSCGSLC